MRSASIFDHIHTWGPASPPGLEGEAGRRDSAPHVARSDDQGREHRPERCHPDGRFARTAAAARRAREEDGTCGSWHLNQIFPPAERGIGTGLGQAIWREWRPGWQAEPDRNIRAYGVRRAPTLSAGADRPSDASADGGLPHVRSVDPAGAAGRPLEPLEEPVPAGDDQVQLYARRAQIAAPGRSFRPGPRRPGYARPEAPDGLALSRRPLLAGSILGGLCGLALAVFASGSLVGPQGLWASAAISEEEQAPAPAAAELQPLAPEDHSRARTAAPLPAVHVRTDPVRSTPAAYVPAPKLAGPELAATEPEAVPEQQSDSGSGAVRWDLLYERAHDHQRKGDLAAATDLFGEAARLQPAHPAILYDWGYALQLQGRWQDAIDRYRQAIAVDPDHPYAHYNLGALLHRRGDEAGALESYRRSAELRPDNPALHLDWGSLLEHRGDLAGAAEHYRRAADLAPQSGPGMDARRRLARIDPSW